MASCMPRTSGDTELRTVSDDAALWATIAAILILVVGTAVVDRIRNPNSRRRRDNAYNGGGEGGGDASSRRDCDASDGNDGGGGDGGGGD